MIRVLSALITMLLVLPFGAAALTIDDFDTAQSSITVAPAGPNEASSSVATAGGDIIGLGRDMRLSIGAGMSVLSSQAEVAAGRAFFANASPNQATLMFQWDGIDNSANLNATGLLGMDLTEGNAANAFEINFLFDDLPASITLNVYTDAGNYSTATFPTAGGLFGNGTPGLSVFVPFDLFSTAAGSGADFANVGAIEMIMTSPLNGADIEIDYVRTALAPVPLPPAMLLFASGLLGLLLTHRRPR